jgi:plastocyanin
MALLRALRSGSLFRRRTLAALALAVVVATTGCGDDGGGDDGVSADESSGAAVCSPVGESLEPAAAKTVAVKVQEYSYTPAQVDVAAGVVTFAVTNAGTENHELAFLPGGGDVPLNPQGDPDEDALTAAGAFELEAFGAGGSCNATYDLKPGTYTMFCLVTSSDGLTHYQKGMRGRLVVA